MTNFVIGYFGDGPWAHRALERLLINPDISVAFVCSRHGSPDQVLSDLAGQSGVPSLSHRDVNSDDFLGLIPAVDYDLFVSMSFDQIFSSELIELPRLQTINCHAGKLPFYRGRNVLNWVLINGETEFGITVHQVDEGIDTGDILTQLTLPITDEDTYATLLTRAHEACPELLIETVEALRSGSVRRQRQSEIHPVGSYCRIRSAGDERLEWGRPSREIFNFVRAICRPGPEARSWIGASEIRINRVEERPSRGNGQLDPGTVTTIGSDYFDVATSDREIRVVEWRTIAELQVGDCLK